MITNQVSGTRVDEVADGLFRISTPVTLLPGGFSFNQYLIVASCTARGIGGFFPSRSRSRSFKARAVRTPGGLRSTSCADGRAGPASPP